MKPELILQSPYKERFGEPAEETLRLLYLYPKYEFPEEENYSYTDYQVDAYSKGPVKMLIWSLKDFPQLKIRMRNSLGLYNSIELTSIVDIVFSVPDLRLFNTITAIDESHRDQAWVSRTNPELVLRFELTESGDITIYEPTRGTEPQVRWDLYHLYGKLLKRACPRESALFDALCTMEGAVSYDGKKKWTSEQTWANLFLMIFAEDKVELQLLASYMDALPALLVCGALKTRLNSLPASLRSSKHESYRKILDYVNDKLPAAAEERLSALQLEESFESEYRNYLENSFISSEN